MSGEVSFQAGAYDVTVNANSLGRTEVGFEVIKRPSFVPIRADETGRSPVEGIWTGVEDMIIRLEGIEWTPTIWRLAIPWLHYGSTEGKVEPSGQLISALAMKTSGFGTGAAIYPIILTPHTGSAVANATAPGTYKLKYSFGLYYPLEPVRTILSAQRLRTVNMGFYCFASGIGVTHEATMYTSAVVA